MLKPKAWTTLIPKLKETGKLTCDIPCNKAVTMFIALLVTACARHQGCHAASRGNLDSVHLLLGGIQNGFRCSTKHKCVAEP